MSGSSAIPPLGYFPTAVVRDDQETESQPVDRTIHGKGLMTYVDALTRDDLRKRVTMDDDLQELVDAHSAASASSSASTSSVAAPAAASSSSSSSSLSSSSSSSLSAPAAAAPVAAAAPAAERKMLEDDEETDDKKHLEEAQEPKKKKAKTKPKARTCYLSNMLSEEISNDNALETDSWSHEAKVAVTKRMQLFHKQLTRAASRVVHARRASTVYAADVVFGDRAAESVAYEYVPGCKSEESGDCVEEVSLPIARSKEFVGKRKTREPNDNDKEDAKMVISEQDEFLDEVMEWRRETLRAERLARDIKSAERQLKLTLKRKRVESAAVSEAPEEPAPTGRFEGVD